MDTWKGKDEALKLKCTNLQTELVMLREEVKVVNSLKEAVKYFFLTSNINPSIKINLILEIKVGILNLKILHLFLPGLGVWKINPLD